MNHTAWKKFAANVALALLCCLSVHSIQAQTTPNRHLGIGQHAGDTVRISPAAWKLVPSSPTVVMSPAIVYESQAKTLQIAFTDKASHQLKLFRFTQASLYNPVLDGNYQNWGGPYLITGPSCDNSDYIAKDTHSVMCAALSENGNIATSKTFDAAQPSLTPVWGKMIAGATSAPAVMFHFWESLGHGRVMFRGMNQQIFWADTHWNTTTGGYDNRAKGYQELFGSFSSAPSCFRWQHNWYSYGAVCAAVGSDGKLYGTDFYRPTNSAPLAWSKWYVLSNSTQLDPTARVAIIGERWNSQAPGFSWLSFYARGKNGQILKNKIQFGSVEKPVYQTTLSGSSLAFATWKEEGASIAPGTGPSCVSRDGWGVCVITGTDNKLYYQFGLSPDQ